eukprot:6983672-Pyramimonas_sp.AAC.1
MGLVARVTLVRSSGVLHVICMFHTCAFSMPQAFFSPTGEVGRSGRSWGACVASRSPSQEPRNPRNPPEETARAQEAQSLFPDLIQTLDSIVNLLALLLLRAIGF